MHNRTLNSYLRRKAESRFGRIIVLTGARQTGKTTLVKQVFPEYPYISLDDPVTRPEYAQLSAAQWHARYPVAILDEVQKLPELMDTIKAVHDQYPETRYVLLGSSQILLLEKVRESLAGRAALVELYPLTLPECLSRSWDDPIQPSRCIRLLSGESIDLSGMPLADATYAKAEKAFNGYLSYGAMPAIVDTHLPDEERFEWLMNYIQTYLQRDVRDLANLRELEPFIRAQKSLATLSGQLLNISALARQAGISHTTARRFIHYLELSYQTIQLPPWFRNNNKRLAKSPKHHMLDLGIQKTLLNRRGDLTGHEFESAVIAEIYKQIKTHRIAASCYHLRTLDGREVDMLIELDAGYIAIEVKQANRVVPADARHLSHLRKILDKPLLHAWLVSNDPRVHTWEDISAMPVAWLLGPLNQHI